jgi:hypothetical protein
MPGNRRETQISTLPRAGKSSKQKKGFNKKGQKGSNPLPSTSSLGKKEGDKKFKADKRNGDAPRCFKCGSTDHLIADCPEASPDQRIRKGKKLKFVHWKQNCLLTPWGITAGYLVHF